MPAFYAHHSFGEKVLSQFNKNISETKEIKNIIERYRPQFDIGLQGPDLFFFYKAYKKNHVSDYGNSLHSVSAYPFFERAVKKISEMGCNNGSYAYLMGFVCHYILDSECHHYIDKMAEEIGVHHIEIEEEFEKFILRKDGKDALSYPIGNLVPTDEITVESISPFYDERSKDDIITSLKYLKMVKHLFTAPGKFKQTFINTVMKAVGKYPTYKGLMNQRIDNPLCKQTNEGIVLRFDNSIDIALKMILSLDESIKTGKPIDKRFDRNFL